MKLTVEMVEERRLAMKCLSPVHLHESVDEFCDAALRGLQVGEPVAFRREWEGDDSDLGQWIYEDDPHALDAPKERWQALYATPQPAPPPMTKEEQAEHENWLIEQIRKAAAPSRSEGR